MADIKYLDQIRAKNAFNACSNTFSGKDNGEVVKKLPPLIRGCGILGALAFALIRSKNGYKNSGYKDAFDAIAIHLKSLGKINAVDAENLQIELLECSSLKLRDTTAETMLYLDYMRRFAKKSEEN
jgi:CRISPR/Cas system CMR-associated protein Cmr5 small subunit